MSKELAVRQLMKQLTAPGTGKRETKGPISCLEGAGLRNISPFSELEKGSLTLQAAG